MKKVFAGIGSRKTPDKALYTIRKIARFLSQKGFVCRNGGAKGADLAFSAGSTNQEVYLARDATEESMDLAKRLHPNWVAVESSKNSDYVKRLLGRNMQIVLGRDISNPDPVDFLVCWTPGAKTTGGSSHAINLSKTMGIPVYNIADPDQLQALRDFASTLGPEDL